MINLVQDYEGFKKLKETWERLVSKSNVRIFQTYAWCDAAWRFLDDGQNRLYVMVWTQEKRDEVVIFPFYVDRVGVLRFIMDEHSDYCDCVYVAGANHHLAFKEALDIVRDDKTIRRINLSKMDGCSEALNYWGMLLSDSRISRVNTYSWIDVPKADDFAAAQEQLRSKDKANVRAIRRKSDRYQLRVLSRANGDKFPRAHIQILREEMIRAGRRDESFLSERFVTFCDEIYMAGGQIVEISDQQNVLVALNFILAMGGRRLSWVFLYADPHASTEMYVKYLYERGRESEFIFDFGTGGYDYKLGTFRPHLRTLFALQYDNCEAARRASVFLRFVRGLKDLVKYYVRHIKEKGHRLRDKPH